MFNQSFVGGAADKVTCHVARFIMHETGTFDMQFRRPYKSIMNGRTMGLLQEALNGSPKYQATQIAGIANQIVAPTATPESTIDIPNGWGNRRLRFFLELQYNSQMHGSNSEYIMGYSEFSDLSITGRPDPRSLFVVNSVSNVRHTTFNNGVQNLQSTTPGDVSHVINNSTWGGPVAQGGLELMRPADVFAMITRQDIQPEMQQMGVFDQRVAQDSIPKKSFRGNAIASNYVASILANHQMAVKRDTFGSNGNDAMEVARGNAAEPLVGADFFLSNIAEVRGSALGNQFTLNDLKKLDSTFESRTVIARLGDHANQVYSAGQAQGWHGTDMETQIANILSQAVPSLLMETGLTLMDFQATNMGIVGIPVKTQINNANGFAKGLDYTPNIMLFIQRFEHELFRDLTQNNQFGLAITMSVDILGETRIRIQLESNPVTDFVTPSFCDALMVPILTADPNVVMGMTADMSMTLNKLSGDRVISNALSGNVTHMQSNY